MNSPPRCSSRAMPSCTQPHRQDALSSDVDTPQPGLRRVWSRVNRNKRPPAQFERSHLVHDVHEPRPLAPQVLDANEQVEHGAQPPQPELRKLCEGHEVVGTLPHADAVVAKDGELLIRDHAEHGVAVTVPLQLPVERGTQRGEWHNGVQLLHVHSTCQRSSNWQPGRLTTTPCFGKNSVMPKSTCNVLIAG